MLRAAGLTVPVLLLFTAGLCSSAGGATTLAQCAGIETSRERLDCYDALVIPAARDGAAGWTLDSNPSRPNPDLIDYVLWTPALDAVPGAGGGEVLAILQLECRQGQTAAVFDFGRIIGSGLVRIEYRVGQGSVLTGDVTIAPDGRRFGVWDGARAVGFIKALYGKPQLRLRVMPPDGAPLLAIFELAGIEEMAGLVEKSCAWK